MKNKKLQLYAVCFALPVVILGAMCAQLGITPCGDSSFAISDMTNQYIDYYAYYKSILSGENDIFYTFSKSMGGDMVGLTAYYLLSPFNLIFLLFGQAKFPLALTVIVLLKCGLCGLTAGICLDNSTENPKQVWLFATSYALMSYNIAFCFNTMWIDGVFILPVVALGIDRLIKNKRIGLYIFGLVYGLITCYYTGYMLCIFSVIYFAYRVVLWWQNDFADNFKTALRFGVASLLSGGLSAVVLVPTFMALSGTKAGFDTSILTLEQTFPAKELLYKLFGQAYNLLEVYDGLPQIFCGVIITALVVMFFFGKGISVKEKLCAAAVITVFIISMTVTAPNLVWHGFNYPSCFLYRYSFMFSFFMICFAFKAWQNVKEFSLLTFIVAAVAVTAGGMWVYTATDLPDYLTQSGIVSDLVLTLVFIALCIVLNKLKGNMGKAAVVAVAAVQIFSLYTNGLAIPTLIPTSAAEYDSYITDVRENINWINAQDDGFYRTEKTFQRTNNDPMQFAYNGLSHFSSTEKGKTKDFIGQFGFRNQGIWVKYGRGSTAAADSFLGVKYLLCKDETHKPYETVHSASGITVYRNPYALPMAFVSHSNVTNLPLAADNTFEFQNAVFSQLAGKDVQIFTPAQTVAVTTEYFDVSQEENFIRYTKTSEEFVPSIHYTIKATQNGPMYAYFYAPKTQSSELLVNGVSLGKYFDSYQWDAVYLGSFSEGDEITVTISTTRSELLISDAVFCHEDISALADCYSTIIANSTDQTVTKLASSHLEWQGSIAKDSTVVFTVPYENGWSAYLDGEKADIVPLMDNIIGVSVPQGSHTLEIKFIPPGLAAGAAISLLCLATLILYTVIIRRKSK